MTLVLAHGALGYWDEVINLTLMLIAVPSGLVLALLKGKRAATPLPDEASRVVGPGDA